jgi:hypothetical protein
MKLMFPADARTASRGNVVEVARCSRLFISVKHPLRTLPAARRCAGPQEAGDLMATGIAFFALLGVSLLVSAVRHRHV